MKCILTLVPRKKGFKRIEKNVTFLKENIFGMKLDGALEKY